MRREFAISALLVGVVFGLTFNHWQGDPTIYFVYAQNLLRGEGLCFNPGFPSASFSSPLWLMLVASVGAVPELVKTLSLGIFLWGIYLIQREKGLVASGIVIYFAIMPSLLCYETPLLVLATGFFLSRRENMGAIILTLARPEAVLLIPFLFLFHPLKWWVFVPAVIYYAPILATIGIPMSFIARSTQPQWVETRYFLVLLPLLPFVVDIFNDTAWRKWVIVGLCVVGTALKLPKEDNDFETATYKSVSEYVKPGDKILTTEIQARYWMRDVMMVSMDNLLREKVEPTLYIRTLNDTLEMGELVGLGKEKWLRGVYRIKEIP